jgi:hypothetical protein
MKRDHPISQEHKRCTAARDPVRKLEKQYEELCRLREQVQIAESRQRVLSRDMPHDGPPLKPVRPQPPDAA